MPTPTYTLISETVLGSAQASVTFSSIPGTYKDLVVEILYFSNENTRAFGCRYNGDSGTNYSATHVAGNGSAASSGRNSNNTYAEVNYTVTASSTVPTSVFINILNYANTNMFKTSISRSGKADELTWAYASLWRSTSAITSIELRTFNSGNLLTGSVFRLWGVLG